MSDPLIGLVIRLHKMGRSPEYIANRIAKTPGWVREVLREETARAYEAQVEEEELVDEGEEIWSGETKRIKQEFLVPKCFKVWNAILDDPDATYSAKLKAADSIMKYDINLVDNTKEDPEKVTNIVMTDEQMERFLRLEGRDKEWN